MNEQKLFRWKVLLCGMIAEIANIFLNYMHIEFALILFWCSDLSITSSIFFIRDSEWKTENNHLYRNGKLFCFILVVVVTHHLVYWEQSVDVQNISPPIVGTIHMIIGRRVEYRIIGEPFHGNFYNSKSKQVGYCQPVIKKIMSNWIHIIYVWFLTVQICNR